MNAAMTNSPCQANAFTIEQMSMTNNNYLPAPMTDRPQQMRLGTNIGNEPGLISPQDNRSCTYPTQALPLCNPGQICSTGCRTDLTQGQRQHQVPVAPLVGLDRSFQKDTPDNIVFANVPVTSTSAVHNFTFTTPTQSYLHSPALVSYTQPRYQGSRTISHSFAPVGFTHWQHSVPQRIPWCSAGLATQAAVSIFTGSSSPSLTSPSQFTHPATWTSVMAGPVASCSEEPKRPKRHASEDLQYLGSSAKVHLTEEKFAKHMEGLSLHCMATDKNTVTNGVLHTSVPPDRGYSEERVKPRLSLNITAAHSPMCKQWENFQHLEESLEVSDEEGDNQSCGSRRRKTPPTIHMVKDLDKLLANPDIIPKNILAEIRRPRMELVLWNPPSGDKSADSTLQETTDEAKSVPTGIPDDEDNCMETDGLEL